MYELKHELPKEFKIKVNPKQSEVLQKHLFSVGIKWTDDDNLRYLDMPYLYIQNGDITYGMHSQTFENNFKSLPKIKFKYFFEKVEEFPEKWCILVTEDNYQELNRWMHRNWKNYPQYQDSWIILPLYKLETDKIFYSHANNSSLGGWSGKLNDIAEGFELITTEQFRAKYGDLKPKEILTDARCFYFPANVVLPLEIDRLKKENDKLKHQILMLTEKLETIKKVIE